MAGSVYTFGPFRLEVDERRLLRDGQLVPLVGKAFDTLVALVEGAGALQKQRALHERLWPGVVVAPNNLQHSVSVVRRALGNAPGVALQTVRGQGYRLLAEVRRNELRGGVRRPVPVTAAFGAQRGYFCKAADGARLAYAKVGSGAPIVKAAHGLGHLELDRGSPLWAPWIRLLSSTQCLVRYDLRGHGLSAWQPPALSFDAFVSDLGAVFDAAGIERAPVLGISHGAAVAAAYAARYPERVSGLVLIGGCARGWRAKGDPALIERFSALMVLMRQGCGTLHAEFRQLISAMYFPQAPQHHIDWFSDLQRQATTPANAAQLLSSVGDVNISRELAAVRAPTLVLHSRGDMVVPMTDGIELATGIPRARFVPLESKNHVLHAGEPAWERLTSEVALFLTGIGARVP